MKRQMKLIFQILKYAEANVHNGEPAPMPEFDEYSRSEVEYHVKLCDQAGYIDYIHGGGKRKAPVSIENLTWAGHDALDRMRKDGCCAKSDDG
ncbi:MAG: DUF2513 domain-containing protein [Albidovulum sp.]|nr:DUF2513 domain-containing protein [Albidovulum sp.]